MTEDGMSALRKFSKKEESDVSNGMGNVRGILTKPNLVYF